MSRARKPEPWTVEDLFEELGRFEEALTQAGLTESSVGTYVGRSHYFIRWLAGDYEPRGPQGQHAES